MKYDNLRAFEKHLESAAPSHFSSLYVVLGKEPIETKEAFDLLAKSLLPNEKDRFLCLSVFDGSQISKEVLLSDLESLSFFVQKRVIAIQQADKLKKEITEGLEHYFTHPNPNCYIILLAQAIAKNTSFYKKFEKIGVILELAEPKPWEKEKRLIEWLNKQIAAVRKLMAYPVCQSLVKASGMDHGILKQELEKLLCYVGEKKEITGADVAAICTNINAETVWQLGEALFCHDRHAALRIGRGLLEEGTALLPLLRQIRSQFQTEYQICTLIAQGAKSEDITQDFPYMKGQILERHMHLAQQYGQERFKQGLLAIDAMELQAKNSQLDEAFLLDLLIIKLT